MQRSLNPGSRPRRGLATGLVLAVLASLVAVAVAVGTGSSPAAAAGLEQFESCGALSRWGRDSGAEAPVFSAGSNGAMLEDSATAGAGSAAPGGDVAVARETAGAGTKSDQVATSIDPEATGEEVASTGGTNVVVDGVDELDLVDRVDARRALFSSSSALVLVDLQAGARLARVALPYGAQITFDPDRSVVWTAGPDRDGARVEVRRIALDSDRLEERGRWSTPGSLVTARRVGDLLHVVATDGFATASIPFAGEPVPCDQVLHPSAPSDPSATLIATFSAIGSAPGASSGELAPLRATEVVGSGQLVHVTSDAAYLATPQWGGQVSTTIHRFDLSNLHHTGSGRVPGTLLNDFSMSDHDGYLRVAVTATATFQRGVAIDDVAVAPQPTPTEVEPSGTPTVTEIAPAPPASVPPTSAPEPAEKATEPMTTAAEPPTTEPTSAGQPTTTTTESPTTEPTTTEATTTTTEAATTTTEATTTTTEAATTTTEAATTTTEAATTTTEALEQPGPGEGLNRIYVLDTDGDLDVVGKTGWFGHDGETLYGIRFDGATAYAVTFMQTDPFYVIDLSDPAAPRVAGELQLPGFSGYLHPVGDGLVVGFGPGRSGQVEAKLFDVSDAAAPKVVGDVVLGDEAPVVYDHHAFTDLGGGRFATVASEWGAMTDVCMAPESSAAGEGEGDRDSRGCVAPSAKTDIVELQVRGGHLREVARTEVSLTGTASRVLAVDDGWAVLADPNLVLVAANGTPRATVDLA